MASATKEEEREEEQESVRKMEEQKSIKEEQEDVQKMDEEETIKEKEDISEEESVDNLSRLVAEIAESDIPPYIGQWWWYDGKLIDSLCS